MVDLVAELTLRLVHPLTLSRAGAGTGNPVAEGTAGNLPRCIRARIPAAQDALNAPELARMHFVPAAHGRGRDLTD